MRQSDKEYARALFMLASEEGICNECLEDLCLIRRLLLEERAYVDLLSSPAIPLAERLSAIDEAFSGSIGEYTVYFLKLLCEKGRMRDIFDAIREYEALYKELSGRSTAVVISAAELSDEQKDALLARLERVTGKRIDFVWRLDPELIGGLRIEIDGKVYDGTLKSRLRDVKEVMMTDAT
ncbi:MAG: ATP synthase F1 subunit delta [Clostridia bacterium]|nr:ATP synthase F1 subunit delta [Clostridia bacterium]